MPPPFSSSGFFACQPLGTPLLKGQASRWRSIACSMRVWPAVVWKPPALGWTPLVGREEEVRLLRERWTQAKDGVGQVVLLSGEAGIGKSRLVQVLEGRSLPSPRRG